MTLKNRPFFTEREEEILTHDADDKFFYMPLS